jgi:hypothetical protein
LECGEENPSKTLKSTKSWRKAGHLFFNVSISSCENSNLSGILAALIEIARKSKEKKRENLSIRQGKEFFTEIYIKSGGTLLLFN